MRRAVLFFLVLAAAWLAAPARAADAPESRVFLETSLSTTSPRVGEPVRLTLLAGFDRAFFAEHAVALFTRRMDLDARITVPWLGGMDGSVLVGSGPAPAEANATVRVAVNDDVVPAARVEDRLVDGRPFTVLRFSRMFVFESPGEVEIPSATIRFAWATRFAEDFVSGRVPVDRQETRVARDPFRLTVRPLPAEAPEGFTGAVGRFRVTAQASPREVDTGQILKLTLRIEGEGNLTLFDTPRLGGLDGFHMYGALDDRASPVRTVVYDVAPLEAGVDSVPAIEFPSFDPGAGEFRTARTEPIPLVVLGASSPGPGSVSSSHLFEYLAAFAVFALLTLSLLFRRAHKGRERSREDPERERCRLADAAFSAAMEDPGADPGDALASYLAVRLGRPVATVIGPDLRMRLVAEGVPGDLAGRAAGRLEELVAARYGGGADERSAEAARQLVAELSAVRFADERRS